MLGGETLCGGMAWLSGLEFFCGFWRSGKLFEEQNRICLSHLRWFLVLVFLFLFSKVHHQTLHCHWLPANGFFPSQTCITFSNKHLWAWASFGWNKHNESQKMLATWPETLLAILGEALCDPEVGWKLLQRKWVTVKEPNLRWFFMISETTSGRFVWTTWFDDELRGL